jgi:hypothetical protein
MNTEDIQKLAETLRITLDSRQLNIGGERELMSPDKMVLTGVHTETNNRIVLKCADSMFGVKEIVTEHSIRETLKHVSFSEKKILMPEEIFYGTINGYSVSVTDFLEQEKVFTDYDLEKQFSMSLDALQAQESFHIDTKEKIDLIDDIFVTHTPEFYLENYALHQKRIEDVIPHSASILSTGYTFLLENLETLRTFDRYLIHSDFVPHNFRIHENQLYVLDFVSFRLGNKYESWARFINFMEIHSPLLVPKLLVYAQSERGADEYRALRLMRAYKTCFILNYYAQILANTAGDLHELTKARLVLGLAILESVIHDTALLEEIRQEYYKTRDRLRTDAEKERQRQFTWA